MLQGCLQTCHCFQLLFLNFDLPLDVTGTFVISLCSSLYTSCMSEYNDNVLAFIVIFMQFVSYFYILSTLVISTSVIPNNRLSRRENPVHV